MTAGANSIRNPSKGLMVVCHSDRDARRLAGLLTTAAFRIIVACKPSLTLFLPRMLGMM
jgi:hypothetical protein